MASDRGWSEAGPAGETVVGRYSLGRLLGEGGMGRVYEATHLDLGKRVAVKTLNERYSAIEDAHARFLREGRAAAQIRHPNITDVYDVGVEGGHCYLVMELLEGETLAAALAREGVLSPQRTADLMVPVVAAMAAAHGHGVVHRDLKPDNVFLARGPRGVTPKVLDFGISKIVEAEDASALTGSGVLLGTPHYLSPEQAAGSAEVDERSDQYSLGVILYQCVTGRRPHEGLSLLALIQRTIQGDFPAPRQLNSWLPNAFEAIVLTAMAQRPERRFATTRALGQALLPFASPGIQEDLRGELSVDGSSAASHVAAAPSSALVNASTLGASARALRPVSSVRHFGWRIKAGVSVLVACAGAAWLLPSHEGPPAFADMSQPGAGASQPVLNGTSLLMPRATTHATGARQRAASVVEAAPTSAAPPAPRVSHASPAALGAPPATPSERLAPELPEAAAEQRDPTDAAAAWSLLDQWRSAPTSERCRAARAAWSRVAGRGGDPGTAARALEELGECSPTPAAAKTIPREVAGHGDRGTQPEPQDSRGAHLPADDPQSGFVDLEGN